jgi:predicted Zn finger-like uncharacterized protein
MEGTLSDADLRYTFTCPNCSGSFSITLDRIPPVQARFRCPHCKKPMDFPSRDEARVYARLQAQGGSAQTADNGRPPEPERVTPAAAPAAAAESPAPNENTRFRVEKLGYEEDVFDRRSLRNLIRTGAVGEQDKLRVNDGEAVRAGDLPYLKSLFSLRRNSTAEPPPICRSHTDKVAFFQCASTARPLCEDCAPEKKFGSTTLRVCQHCGGTATELPSASSA